MIYLLTAFLSVQQISIFRSLLTSDVTAGHKRIYFKISPDPNIDDGFNQNSRNIVFIDVQDQKNIETLDITDESVFYKYKPKFKKI